MNGRGQIAFLGVLLAWLAVFPIAGHQTGLAPLAHALAVAALGLLAARRLWGERAVRPGLPGAAIALALLSLGVAVAAAPERFPRLELERGATIALRHVAFFAACWVLAPQPGASEAERRRASRGLALLLAATIAGQIAFVWLGPAFEDAGSRPAGALGNPNVLGAVLAAGALALAGLASFRPGVLLLLSPVLLVVVATRSRGAVMAFGVVVMALALRRRWRRLIVAVALTGAILALVPNPLRERVLAMQPEHDFTRRFLWSAALESIAGHPLGIGPAMNKYVFPAKAWNPDFPWMLHQRHAVGLTHNVFLTLTLEWGWLAGGALLGLTAWAARRLLPRGPPDPLRGGAALGAAVLFVELQVDGLEQNPAAFSIFLLLLATALAGSRARGERRGLALPGRVAAGGLALLAFATLPWVLREARGTRLAESAQALVAEALAGRADEQAARAAVAAAQAGQPRDARAQMLRFELESGLARRRLEQQRAGEALERAGEALEAVQRARLHNAADWVAPRAEARFTLWLLRNVERRDAWQRAFFAAREAQLAADPLDVEGHWDLAQEAHGLGREDLFERELRTVVSLEPDHAFAWFVAASLFQAKGGLERSVACWVRAEEAVLNCHVKAALAHPKTRDFYVRNLEKADLAVIRKRLVELRWRLYF